MAGRFLNRVFSLNVSLSSELNFPKYWKKQNSKWCFDGWDRFCKKNAPNLSKKDVRTRCLEAFGEMLSKNVGLCELHELEKANEQSLLGMPYAIMLTNVDVCYLDAPPEAITSSKRTKVNAHGCRG
ncbi:1755_t:CDS:2 [Gigaspora rosea]|nr:1755_t:CDS:2 [Gigaspora rosea]